MRIPHALLIAVVAMATVPACGGSPMAPTPPVETLRVSCPADVSVGGATVPPQVVTFAPPTTTGGAAPVSVACTPASGSAFIVGSTQVNCTAVDAAAQQATCAFRVTVTAPGLAVKKFVAFGDSVTEGNNGTVRFGIDVVDQPNAYPTKLQALFDFNYPGQGITVVNEGRSGERIEDGKSRLPGVLAEHRPGALLLIDGYNNLLEDCKVAVGVTPACEDEIALVLGSLRELVRIARGASVSYVFVGTLTPPGPYGGGNDRRIANAAITRVNAGIRQFIPLENGLVVDLYQAFLGHEAEYIASDGLHITPPGNQAIADAFFAAIRATVPSTGTAHASAIVGRLPD